MKKRLFSSILVLLMLVGLFPTVTLTASAATVPTKMWVESSDMNGIPARIDVFKKRVRTGGSPWNPTYSDFYQLYLPGNADIETCFLSWDGDMQATVDGTTYTSGMCPVPPVNTEKIYSFGNGSQTLASFNIVTYQGSPNVQRVFIDIDESQGTIAKMDSDKENTCSGAIYINEQQYELTKMKGRGNATWDFAEDKKPYNITLGNKINFPGVASKKTKKWSFLAEVTDHSLLSNRSGFYLGEKLGIGQSTTSADVWMNGEYQGCYTVTPKTDSFVSNDGFMIEQDNYLEPDVANGGDPQFRLDGLISNVSGWSSVYNIITVKKMGDNLLGVNEVGEVNESPENIEAVANNVIRPWMQDAWDAIRSENGYNSKGKYYTDYIDMESFAKMYLMHEYAKSYDICAGSILFYHEGMADDDKLIAGPVWDLDNAMGSTCSNDYLGQGKDRRSGEGSFIPVITEYKTSIYKTISKHPDFMEEVYHQYNKNRSAFDDLPGDVERMISEIENSARMNHYKVNEISGDQYKNTHIYNRATTLGSGQYTQNYLATTDSKIDWVNYALNLKTYVNARSLWFANSYYDPDDPANCEHTYTAVVTPPTCTTEGYTTYTCSKCGDSYTSDITPVIAHNYEDGQCVVCGQTLLNAAISCNEGASVTVYETKNFSGASTENATSANPRNSDTGLIDCSGEGQINFSVNLQPGFELVSVTAEPASAYKNYKVLDDTGIPNSYRLTKVKGDVTITVTTSKVDYSIIVGDTTGGMVSADQPSATVGDIVTLSITPDQGYELDTLYVMDGSNNEVQVNDRYEFVMPAGDVTVQASFKKTVEEGWQVNSTGWWYQNADGTWPKNCWKKIDGYWYHFNARGYRQTGWLKLNDIWYYLQSDGVMVTGWQKIGSYWYYFNNSGAMAHDTWKGNYYLLSSGRMATDTWIGNYYVDSSGKWVRGKVKEGWVQNSTGWWYRNADGTYPKKAWKKIDGKWYHFDDRGYRQTGWLMLNDIWYYLQSDGVMATGWLQIESDYYYFNSNGSMATDTWIDDKYVDSSGKWIKDAGK